MQDFLIWFSRYGSYCLLLSAGMVLFRFQYLTGYLRFVGWFVGLAVAGELVSHLTAHVLHVPNTYILHGYTILEFNIIALVYGRFFGHFYSRFFVPWLMAGFTVLALLNSAFIQPPTGGNAYARGLEAILVIALALLAFYKLLNELSARRLDKQPIFWINTGFLLYFAGSLFFLLFSNVVLYDSNQTLKFAVFALHVLLIVMMHVLISIGLWFSPSLRATSTY
ncbi:hypothetical protein FAES_4948 [Fibrella aestuarina BUZ 2]|uniref:Uncharacterized protein n=1 Tax=Fibrella aestuarina BUZ 2 TaxID=1166018 RepID=I0KFP4_9BACT|nr:hypothetical protein [Fibrella aestuarina]CCH02947.1 hypothetical protein FAES_4948 [Fibrella aestuarina BUZ 2]